MTHYITMAGSHGEMPLYSEVFDNYDDAVENLADVYDLSKRQIAELQRDGSVELNLHKQGNEYAEIEECDCAEPWMHSDNITEKDWKNEHPETESDTELERQRQHWGLAYRGVTKPHTQVDVFELPSCDFCQQAGRDVTALYDGKTQFGSWANMCQKHFNMYGIGLGLGKGQKLNVIKDLASRTVALRTKTNERYDSVHNPEDMEDHPTSSLRFHSAGKIPREIRAIYDSATDLGKAYFDSFAGKYLSEEESNKFAGNIYALRTLYWISTVQFTPEEAAAEFKNAGVNEYNSFRPKSLIGLNKILPGAMVLPARETSVCVYIILPDNVEKEDVEYKLKYWAKLARADEYGFDSDGEFRVWWD